MIAVIVLLAIVIVGVFDGVANNGKAYGNMSVNGMDVSGMTSEEIQGKLKEKYGSSVSHAQITIYANEEAARNGGQVMSDEERLATAEQLSTDEAAATVGSWQTDALSLKAVVPYEQVANEAVSYGKDNLFSRLGLLVGAHDVALAVSFNNDALESLASEIDRTIGDPRIDTTVEIENGQARAVEGHDGTLVDRDWLTSMLSNAMLNDNVPDAFVAVATNAQSRISMDQARSMAESINHAISPGAYFNFQGHNWKADAGSLGDWTRVDIVPEGDSFGLSASIDSSVAVPAVVKGVGAMITSDDVTVTFEKTGEGVMVHAEGSGNIPEVNTAVDDLNQKLYGQGGTAWSGNSTGAVDVTVSESDRPENMTFDEAVNLGVITIIGEYTTEFSTLEGTENRTHNVKLAADILNDGIVGANGGTWDFNDRSGNTNEEAGFWAAGSIVNGEYEDSIGGGICQVATTVFNAVYESGLDVVERHNHSLYIASYPTGRDAAVDYPDLTLIWKNDLPSDVLLKMSYGEDTVTAQLYSVYTGYTVSTETGDWQEGAKYGTRFEVDDSIGSESYYRKTTGSDGSSISITRTVKDDRGNVVSEEQFDSNYKAKDEIYVVGSKVDTSSLVRG